MAIQVGSSVASSVQSAFHSFHGLITNLIRGAWLSHADHFIPWSRYPVDLGHNFVFSHPGCNNDKSDLLAHPEHLARWRECNLDAPSVLEEAFNSSGLAHDVERSWFVAVWAYEQGEQSRAHTYLRKGDFPSLDGSWRGAMAGLRAVAETAPDYDC
jgi:hypothetical protein